jgi:hypothetical protein
MRSRRFSSLFACVATSSGIPASAMALRSASISMLLPVSPSPSSFWIDFNCSRKQVFALALVDAGLGALVELA